jgi:hypothetical protein
MCFCPWSKLSLCNDDIYMFEGQESVNILQLVPIKKTSSTTFTFVMNCIFIWYKVKNILQAHKYLSNHCVLHTLQHKLVCKCPPRHQYISCLYDIWMSFRNRCSFGQNLQPTQSNYASQVIFMCLRSSVFAVAVRAITTGTLGNTAHNILTY